MLCKCFSKGSEAAVRLRDGKKGNSEGRVEIFHDGEWGTVCDDNWSTYMYSDDAVCKQLGYKTSREAVTNGYFGEGTGNIMLDDVSCSVYDNFLYNCDHNGWFQHDCTHDEDVGVVCYFAGIYI